MQVSFFWDFVLLGSQAKAFNKCVLVIQTFFLLVVILITHIHPYFVSLGNREQELYLLLKVRTNQNLIQCYTHFLSELLLTEVPL